MTPFDTLVKQISDAGLIAILRGIPEDKVAFVADALAEGGIRFIELTLGSPGDLNGIS